MTENTLHSLSFFDYFGVLSLLVAIFSFFDLNIKLGKTKQKVITLVATTLKTLLAVTKTNGRLSGRKFCACNIYYLS